MTGEAEKNPVRVALGENVARIRKLRGMTVRDLSGKLNSLGLRLAPSGISEVENASRKVGVDELLVLAIALNTSAVDLIAPFDGRPLQVAEDVEPLDGFWTQLWLQGMTTWPDMQKLGEFVDSASEFRRSQLRRDRRPEIQAIDGLKERVRKAIGLQEDPNAAADMPAKDMADALRSHLEEVESYVKLLAAQMDKIR